jgi:hypothetical protein
MNFNFLKPATITKFEEDGRHVTEIEVKPVGMMAIALAVGGIIVLCVKGALAK